MSLCFRRESCYAAYSTPPHFFFFLPVLRSLYQQGVHVTLPQEGKLLRGVQHSALFFFFSSALCSLYVPTGRACHFATGGEAVTRCTALSTLFFSHLHCAPCMYPQGVHVTALREMKLLREIQHPNVIALRDVFPLKKNIALVRSGGDCGEVPLG
eukprot:631013-Pelagomonas_calceolata.AAC.2